MSSISTILARQTQLSPRAIEKTMTLLDEGCTIPFISRYRKEQTEVMKVILAFDSFKGCMTASQACHAASQGVHAVFPLCETIELPLSDGGEGLVQCVQSLLPVTARTITVHGPLMDSVQATYALSPDGRTAYMEMAAAAGLYLVPSEKRDALAATTYGVGELIADALQQGCTKIIMGIGGSATTDGGQGMIQALADAGWLTPGTNTLHESLQNCRITVACDVTNPLYGTSGAAYIYGPQKGATPQQVALLDSRLRLFATATEQAGLATPEMASLPGAGAAGGLGYGLRAYLRAELKSGIDIVLDIMQFDSHLPNAALVVTGEGKSDTQTLMGKVPHGVLKRASACGVPVWLLSGAIDDPEGQLRQHFHQVLSINHGDDRPLQELMRPETAQTNLKQTISKLMQEMC